MDEERSMDDWRVLIGVVVGGLIGTAGTLRRTRLQSRLEREDRRQSVVREALVEWARCMEHVLSHHENYFGLTELVSRHADPQTSRTSKAKDEVVRVAQECGNASRELDSAFYRYLIVETDPSVRAEVARLNEQTRFSELGAVAQDQRIDRFREGAANIRQDLVDFLQRRAKSIHPS